MLYDCNSKALTYNSTSSDRFYFIVHSSNIYCYCYYYYFRILHKYES